VSAFQCQLNYPLDYIIRDYYSGNYKGFLWEMQCRDILLNVPHITLETNPTNYEDWTHQKVKRSYDICVTYEDGSKEYIECKYRADGGKVYSSWYYDDWATRACNRFMTNNTEAINYHNKRDIDNKDRELSSLSETIVAISKKALKIHKKVVGCNQLSSWNCLISNIINDILEFSSKITRKIAEFGFKIRLKNCIFSLESSVKSRFYKSKLHLPLCLNMKLSSVLGKCQLALSKISLVKKL
jgi:hypothetical protein